MDLVVRADVDGFSHLLVVKSAEAAQHPSIAELRLGVLADGLALSESGPGLQVVDTRTGGAVFEAPTPMMWDSGQEAAPAGGVGPTSAIDRPGESSRMAELDVEVQPGALLLRPDQAMLADPGTNVPVYIDPVYRTARRTAWGFVSKAYPNNAFWKFGGASNSGVGYCGGWDRCAKGMDVKRMSSDDLCTRTSYAMNTSAWLIDYQSREETVSVNCSTTPDRAEHVVSDVRTLYDGGGFGAAPVRGDVTKTEKIADHDGSTVTYVTTETATYDPYGRVLTATDALGNTSTTEYTDSEGLLTQAAATNPLGHVETTTFNPAWGLPATKVDPNAKRTDLGYDPLGRLANVWLPDSPRDRGFDPNLKFTSGVVDVPV